MKRILVLNLFPTANPPVTGGQIRYFHIYNKLSQYYDITLLSQSGHSQHVPFSPTFREIRVPKDPWHKIVTTKLMKELQTNRFNYELNLLKNIILSNFQTVYKKYYDDLYEGCDLIIHESPYMLGYDRHLGSDEKLRVYNSHNHDFLLAKQLWKNQRAKKYLQTVYALENKLVNSAHLVFATSEMDRNNFITMYHQPPDKVKIAPNGINPEDWLKNRERPNGRIKTLFIGANYPPNIEAVDFVVNKLAPKCPDIDFIIAGACCSHFKNSKGSNVTLLGKIGHSEKLELFAKVDIAINPMFSGGGVNLKTLEYLSAGLPLFSTEFGVRGLDVVDKKHYIKAEMDDFSLKFGQYCNDKNHLREMAACGQKFINDNYTWSKIAENIAEEIEKLIRKQSAQEEKQHEGWSIRNNGSP